MAAKLFEVGDVLPANDQVRITWTTSVSKSNFNEGYNKINGSNGSINFGVTVERYSSGISRFNVYTTGNYISIINSSTSGYNNFISPYTQHGGDHAYCDIVIPVPITITNVDEKMSIFTWEAIGNSIPQGYNNITFEENGGSTVTDLTEQTALPSPLPTTTKANHVFAGWYYDSSFTQKANAGDELEGNVSLYAKWYTPTTWCEDIADAIREKESSSGNIKHVDFADRIRAL